MTPASPYQSCCLCPRRCGVDRLTPDDQAGYCGESAALRLACASIHRGEEPPLSGTGGSGTIFVSACNLGCVFCQNWQISTGGGSDRQTPERMGAVVDTELFARICLDLQERGAENINIVTGSHAVPAIVEGIAAVRSLPAAETEGRLRIPVLWNSSAYELPETVELLADTVDVFLPDMKTLDAAIAARYFNAPDYPEFAAAAITKMIEMRPLRFEERKEGPARLVSGVMVRHLVLPGHLEASRVVLRWFADQCMAGRSALLSLMFQYTPPNFKRGSRINTDGKTIGLHTTSPSVIIRVHPWTKKGEKSPQRYITLAEYETVVGWLGEFGIEDGYCQELRRGTFALRARRHVVPGDDWLPDFERSNPFPPNMAVPVWHWKTGFAS